MHAFLIHSQDDLFIEHKTQELLNSLQSIKLSYELENIDNVREIARFTKLTAKEKTTLYISRIDKASAEAQNAFLKSLEEPQENISFILTAKNIEQVIPTILSRVEIIASEQSIPVSEEVITTAQSFFDATIGEQLTTVSKIKKRDEAIEFLEKIILGGHALLLTNQSFALFVEKAQETYNALEKNGNVQVQFTNFVVQLHAA